MINRGDKKAVKQHAIAVVLLAVCIYLLGLFADHPDWVERFYSEGAFPVICHILHPVFNLFPFSVGDVIYIFVIGYLIYVIIQFIRSLLKKRWMQSLFTVTGMVI